MRTKLAILLLAVATAFGQPPPMGQGDGIWVRDAYWGEAQTFDGCNGHQPGNGQYHHHANPVCLRAQLDDNIEVVRSTRTGVVYREKATPTKHSPILGWAFDGYPIYGPYGYSDARNPQSGVRRMRSSFRLRNITNRQTLPDWALAIHPGVPQQLNPNQYGPAIAGQFPLGRYQEDFDFVAGLGDLDVHNGRMAVTPEYPQGTYAYFITIDEPGKPLFPYILGPQYYGTVNGGTERNVPAEATEFRSGGGTTSAQPPVVSAWYTRGANEAARVASGFNPSAGAQTTWPFEVPAGRQIQGGVTTPTNADTQRVRFTETNVYVNANGLGSYVMGPWFDALQPGGIFGSFPSAQNYSMRITRAPAAAATKTASGLGPVGLWVNGVAVFNLLDGASYSNARAADVGGGLVALTAVHVSGVSYERGPQAAGSLMSAFPIFGSTIATARATAETAEGPTSLGGTTVTVRDAAGVDHMAPVFYVSPEQVNYRIPPAAAVGNATVTIRVAGNTATSNIYIVSAYPNLFEPGDAPIAAGEVLVLYGSGYGAAKSATATIGGVEASVEYAGAQGQFGGLDQYNITVPRQLAGRGAVEAVVTVEGKKSNAVRVVVR